MQNYLSLTEDVVSPCVEDPAITADDVKVFWSKWLTRKHGTYLGPAALKG